MTELLVGTRKGLFGLEGEPGADFEVNDLMELLDIVDRINGRPLEERPKVETAMPSGPRAPRPPGIAPSRREGA